MNDRWFQLGCVVATAVIAGCSTGPFATKPPGDTVAQCSGQLTLERGVRSRFSLDLIRHNDDFALYATVPGERIRYRRVKDISFDENRLVLELVSGQDITGRITGDSLEFRGAWEDFGGVLTIDLE